MTKTYEFKGITKNNEMLSNFGILIAIIPVVAGFIGWRILSTQGTIKSDSGDMGRIISYVMIVYLLIVFFVLRKWTKRACVDWKIYSDARQIVVHLNEKQIILPYDELTKIQFQYSTTYGRLVIQTKRQKVSLCVGTGYGTNFSPSKTDFMILSDCWTELEEIAAVQLPKVKKQRGANIYKIAYAKN